MTDTSATANPVETSKVSKNKYKEELPNRYRH